VVRSGSESGRRTKAVVLSARRLPRSGSFYDTRVKLAPSALQPSELLRADDAGHAPRAALQCLAPRRSFSLEQHDRFAVVRIQAAWST